MGLQLFATLPYNLSQTQSRVCFNVTWELFHIVGSYEQGQLVAGTESERTNMNSVNEFKPAVDF